MSPVKPLVSVIMNCHNSDAFLKEAIESVYAQTFSDWEIVFFDNASIDKSQAIAKSYDDKIQYFYVAERLSLGHARNAAIAKARGQYIAILDCDDLWLPTKLEQQVASFKQGSDSKKPLGLCYTSAVRISSDGKELSSYARERKTFSGEIYHKLIDDCFIPCSSVMLTKQALMYTQGFDVRWNQVEDWDLWLRIAKHYTAAYVEAPVTKIRLHANNLSRNISAHFKEKIELLEDLKRSDPAVCSHCLRMIAELTLQQNIAEFLLANKNKFVVRSKLLLAIAWSVIKNPRIFIKTLGKYVNRDMIALFKLKFFNSGA